jgi:hypothetical protein
MSTIGALINLGIVVYLGIQAKSCMDPAQVKEFDITQDPFILSFVAIVALFIALKNR